MIFELFIMALGVLIALIKFDAAPCSTLLWGLSCIIFAHGIERLFQAICKKEVSYVQSDISKRKGDSGGKEL